MNIASAKFVSAVWPSSVNLAAIIGRTIATQHEAMKTVILRCWL